MQRGNRLHRLKDNNHSDFGIWLLKLYSFGPLECFFSYEGRDFGNYWVLIFSYSFLTPGRLGVRWRSVKAHCGIFKIQGRENDRLFAFSLPWFHDGVQLSHICRNINFLSFLSFLFLREWTHSLSHVTAFRCCARKAVKPCCRAIKHREHTVQRVT